MTSTPSLFSVTRRSACRPPPRALAPPKRPARGPVSGSSVLVRRFDPNFRIHVSDRLLEIHDGPFLELGLKGIVGQEIQLPRRSKDRPDRDRLALRFEQFKKAA